MSDIKIEITIANTTYTLISTPIVTNNACCMCSVEKYCDSVADGLLDLCLGADAFDAEDKKYYFIEKI